MLQPRERVGAADSLANQMGRVNSTRLASATGVPTQLASTPPTFSTKTVLVTKVVTTVQQMVCPAGFWCTAGYKVPCDIATYNPHTNADNQTACIRCPPHSTTRNLSATSIAA